jgi:hypothetical protein
MSRDIGDTVNLYFGGPAGFGPRRDAEGLVVLRRVDGELADELAGRRMNHPHLEVVDKDDHTGGTERGARTDVVHAALGPARGAIGSQGRRHPVTRTRSLG